MKTLIINNHTKHLAELLVLFSHPEVIEKENLKEGIDVSAYELIVISGGSGVLPVLDYPDSYKIENDLIKTSTKAILGICLGSEIITDTFGGKLQKLAQPHKGIIKLNIVDEELKKIIGKDFVEVHEAHSIGIKEVPEDFIICATSDHGVEIMKHNSKPIVAIQFHPEIAKNEDLFNWIVKTLHLI